MPMIKRYQIPEYDNDHKIFYKRGNISHTISTYITQNTNNHNLKTKLRTHVIPIKIVNIHASYIFC